MNKKDTVVCFGSMCLFIVSVFFSYTGYEKSLTDEPAPIRAQKEMHAEASDPLGEVTVDTLNMIVPLSGYEAVNIRNPFERVRPIVKKAPKKIIVPQPERREVIESVPLEPEPEVYKETFLYRGIVVLGDKKKFVIERESDGKTYFLNTGDATRDFVILDAQEKQVVISDFEGEITVLKKTIK